MNKGLCFATKDFKTQKLFFLDTEIRKKEYERRNSTINDCHNVMQSQVGSLYQIVDDDVAKYCDCSCMGRILILAKGKLSIVRMSSSPSNVERTRHWKKESGMGSLFSRFLRDESGAAAIEYGLIAAIIGVGVVASLSNVKNALNAKFNGIGTSLNGAT